jgi:hypothetical protein
MWTIADDVRMQLTSNLQAVVTAGRKQIDQQSNALTLESGFLEAVTALIESECPEFRSHYHAVLAELTPYQTCVEDFNKDQLRAVEDMNDIAERFIVLCRISEERVDAKDVMKDAKAVVERTRTAYNRAIQSDSPKRYDLCAKLTTAIDKAIEQVHRVQELDSQFIAAKQTYNEFRNRRTRQSYVHLAAAFGEVKASEADVWQRVDAKITEVRETFRDGIAPPSEPAPKPSPEPVPTAAPGPIQRQAVDAPAEEEPPVAAFVWQVPQPIEPLPHSEYYGGNPFMES